MYSPGRHLCGAEGAAIKVRKSLTLVFHIKNNMFIRCGRESQSISSDPSLQSYLRSHLLFSGMQEPSRHWNSSSRQARFETND